MLQNYLINIFLNAIIIFLDQPAFVLDLGCGSGLSGECLEENGHFWVGIDISQSMLKVAQEREVEGDLLLGDLVKYYLTSFSISFQLKSIFKGRGSAFSCWSFWWSNQYKCIAGIFFWSVDWAFIINFCFSGYAIETSPITIQSKDYTAYSPRCMLVW